jgi:hypothetical protein
MASLFAMEVHPQQGLRDGVVAAQFKMCEGTS